MVPEFEREFAWRAVSGKLRALQVRTATSLLALGPVMFGGVDGIINFLRARGLLARIQNCAR